MEREMTSTDRTAEATSALIVERSAWFELLDAQDRRCDEQGLAAGMLTIDFGMPVPQRSDLLANVLASHLTSTDRATFVSDSEVQVMLSPVSDSTEVERRAGALGAALHTAGLAAGVGWAARRDTGLVEASARADAGAAARRPRDPVIDVRSESD
ncbi:MAG: hypothetical protein IH940_05670 [Acidobacteria bacterium]|nr:hypothetical protein [Acidobacteriota bacterium]